MPLKPWYKVVTPREDLREGKPLDVSEFAGHLPSILGAVGLACLLMGCVTPDLKPFAEASKTLATTVNSGGDLAIKPLARIPLWDGSTLVQPGDPKHPAKALEASWAIRRKTMDAVLVYSASLAAINEASAHSKANAAELVGSVKQLAAAVPSIGTGVSAAGDLTVFGLQTFVEVKAWHNMRKAVQAADPAVQLVAKALKKDFVELSNAYESNQRDQIIQMTVALRPVERVYQTLQDQRNAKRASVAAAPSDVALGAELTRLDGLIAVMEPDLNKLRGEKTQLENSMVDGVALFEAASKTVDAWATAHSDLIKCFEQNRAPNLALLTARAEELKDLVDKLKH